MNHLYPLDYPLLFLLVGVLLLLLGRRLFWLFIAAAGFVTGLELAHLMMPHEPELVAVAIALLLGLLGAVLAIFVQKLAIGVAGFLAGGYLAATLYPSLLGIRAAPAFHVPWLLFAIGGVIGAILMTVFFNWALIVLSSLQGAHFILKGLGWPQSLGAHWRHANGDHSLIRMLSEHRGYGWVALAGLTMLGIVVQGATYRRKPPRQE